MTITHGPAHRAATVAIIAREGVALPDEPGPQVRRSRADSLTEAWVEGILATDEDLVALVARPFAAAPGWLDVLRAALDRHPDVVAVTPRLVGAGTAVEVLPVAAPVLLARRSALLRLATVNSAPDDLALASIVHDLTRTGRVEPVPASLVQELGGLTRGTVPCGTPPELTVVIPTLDAAGDRVRGCIRSIQAHTTAPYDIVVVDNGAPAQGFSLPVNAGVRATRSPFVVVCNDDVEVLPGWWEPLRAALTSGATVAFPETVDGPTREDFSAWCFALTREDVGRLEAAPGDFFDPTLRIWYQDTDLLQRLRIEGRLPTLVRASRIRHGLSRTVLAPDPRLQAWVHATCLEDKAAFEALWGVDVPGAAIWR